MSEDERIKSQVELVVTRVGDSNTSLALVAVTHLIELLRTHKSGSVASVPKPLKYIRPRYAQLEKVQKETPDPALAVLLHDVLSFVSMTIDFPDGRRPALEHKLQGTKDDLALWGHEYLRYLAGCISAEWKERVSKGESVEPLAGFVHQIVDYMVTHQDEPTAVDLLIEVENVEAIIPFTGSHNHRRIATYLAAASKYLTRPLDTVVLRAVYDIYVKMESYTEALFVALQLGDRKAVENLFQMCTKPSVSLQMALYCARYRLFLPQGNEENELLSNANGNMKLLQLYRHVAGELGAMKPMTPEDIFKTGLDGKQANGAADSLFKLSCSFASGLVNCGFGEDVYLTLKDATWLSEQTDDRLFATTSMLGFIHLWDHEDGPLKLNSYLHSDTVNIRAGACLASGISLCALNSPFEPALGILAEFICAPQKEVRIGAILGMGYAYAGSMHEGVREVLTPVLMDAEQPLEVQCITALALSMVFVGSTDEDLVEVMVSILSEVPEESLEEILICYFVLALGFLFLGKQGAADTLLDNMQLFSPVIRRYAEVVLRSCAYAATGNVVVIQNFFQMIVEQNEPNEVEEPEKGDDGSEHQQQQQQQQKKKTQKRGTNMLHINHKAAAVLGIALVALGEEIGTEMAKRSIIHALLVDTLDKEDVNMSGRHAIPLAYALLCASNPCMQVVETLNRLSHDSNFHTAASAVIAMGVVAAGSNNVRVLSKLRNLALYYQKNRQTINLFAVRLAQGFTMMGKGHLTLSPLMNDRTLVSPTALTGLLAFLHTAMNFEDIIVLKHSYMVSCIAPSINPRMVLAVDEEMEIIKDGVLVRVGLPVDTVAVAGKPKSITGFQTQTTPTLVGVTDKVEVAPQKYRPVSTVVEGVFVAEEKPTME